MSESTELSKDVALENIITAAIKVPGVKVDREEFLAKVFAKENVDVQKIIDRGPIAAKCSREMLDRIANKLILKRTTESSAVSFAAGIPGGLAMAATIPADTLQYFGMTLRLAQELTYLYGANDLWDDGEVDSTAVRNQLIIYCGVMFGVAGASASLRLLSGQVAKQALKKLPQQALTKTFWYPIVKQICKVIGIKMTKDVAAKGVSKAIPILGGIVSGGLTFASMRPMGKRLLDALDEAHFCYSEEKVMSDLREMEELAEEYAEEVDSIDVQIVEEKKEAPTSDNTEDVFAKIEKLNRLKEMGAITEEEYNSKKSELLAKI